MRGLKTRAQLNVNTRQLGSMHYAQALKSMAIVSNVWLPTKTRSTILCAPGTSGRLVKDRHNCYLLLKHKRRIMISPNSIVQLGANAGHDHWRSIAGGAGTSARAGLRPRVNMRAKNPVSQCSLRHQIKQYHQRRNV